MKVRNALFFSCPRDHKALVMFCLFLLLVSAIPALAQVNGAIFTTISNGTTVNGNIYDAKTNVYLNGGPQNSKDPAFDPMPIITSRSLIRAERCFCPQTTLPAGK